MKIEKKQRRKNGDGSIYQLKDGRFGAAVDLGKDENGKRIRPIVTGKTEEIVREKMQGLLKKKGLLPEIAIVVNSQSPVEDMVREFKLNGLVKSDGKTVTSRTFENYGYSLDIFANYFSGKRVYEIDTQTMRIFFTYLINKKENNVYCYSQVSLDRLEYLVKRMYIRGCKKGFIAFNPFDGEEYSKPISKKPSKEINSLSEAELNSIVAVISKSKVLYTPFMLMLHTGVRTQELLALRWKNLNLEKGYVRITEALTVDVEYIDGVKQSRRTITTTTKMGTGDRTIAINGDMVNMLCEWLNTASTFSKTQFGADDFVFGNTRNIHWTCSGFRTSMCKYLEKNNALIKQIGLHRVRHTVATIMAEDGVNVFHLMKLLGHTQTKTTMKYIDRVSSKIQQENATLLTGALDKRLRVSEK